MPLEVRELIIKATIGENSNENGQAASGAMESDNENMTLKACVDAVLEILRQRNER